MFVQLTQGSATTDIVGRRVAKFDLLFLLRMVNSPVNYRLIELNRNYI